MKGEHLTDEGLLLMFYGERGTTPGDKAHAAACETCRENLRRLTETLRVADEWQVPEPPADFERTVWARLAPQLEDRKRERFAFLRPRVWAVAGAMAVLLVGVFFAGRATKPNARPVIAGLSEKARERILVISLADHLERAGVLLTDLSNTQTASLETVQFDRERAKDLLSEGRAMQEALQLRRDKASEEMLDELERLLLEVANSPDRVTPARLQDWQERIDGDALLFKVRVVETNLRNQGQRL